jgi:hypothetical protein
MAEPKEWEIFKRIEGLEKLKPTLDDTSAIATLALLFSFMHVAGEYPHGARKLKDIIIGFLKAQQLSTKTLNQFETALLQICEESEKQKQ